MILQIDKEKFNAWLSSHEKLSEHSPHHIVIEHYFNEILIKGTIQHFLSLVSTLEQTEAYKNGVLVSELLENEFSAFKP